MRAHVIVVMGVAGSGKTTVGRRLTDKLRFTFVDADDLHPQQNVDKMRNGVALDDEDRKTWLRALRSRIDTALERGEPIVLACSALKEAYRRALGLPHPAIALVQLKVPPELAEQRLEKRADHFMPASLVSSQFSILEEPSDAIVIDAAQDVDTIVQEVTRSLAAR